MLTIEQLRELSFADIKDLVRASDLTIPQHASQEDLVTLMAEHYAKSSALQNQGDATQQAPQLNTTSTVFAPKAVKNTYGGYATRTEYVQAMLAPVLCIITPQAPEFSRQSISSASVSVGNSLIPNREFAFIADGATVTSVPRIAIERIKEMKLLMRGSRSLDKNNMTGNLQGSGFGKRYSLRELNEEEIAEYQAEKQAKYKSAALGVGL